MGCNRHPYDQATAPCRVCQAAFCADCLVWCDGDDHPPTCLRCALAPRPTGRAARRSRPETGHFAVHAAR